MSIPDINKIWRIAGREGLICPQDATVHILGMDLNLPSVEPIIHCDVRFLFQDELGEKFNDRAIRLLETAEKSGRKIAPFDWINTEQNRAHKLIQRKPEWRIMLGTNFSQEIAKRATGREPKAEMALTSKSFGTTEAHVTVVINPPTLMR